MVQKKQKNNPKPLAQRIPDVLKTAETPTVNPCYTQCQQNRTEYKSTDKLRNNKITHEMNATHLQKRPFSNLPFLHLVQYYKFLIFLMKR